LQNFFKNDSKNKISLQLRNVLLLTTSLALIGCSAVATVNTVANIALEVVGIKKNDAQDLPDAQKPPRNISLKLDASENLNADVNGRPLAVVVRIYKLRQNAVFQQAPYNSFLAPQKEKEILGNDLLEVKEITLIPGQRFQAIEKVTKEAYFIGVVALFHSPAPHRWRVAFSSSDVEQSGITIGVHACALSVGLGTAVGDNGDLKKLPSSLHCL
jgi:type VI secretion system protein VasD